MYLASKMGRDLALQVVSFDSPSNALINAQLLGNKYENDLHLATYTRPTYEEPNISRPPSSEVRASFLSINPDTVP